MATEIGDGLRQLPAFSSWGGVAADDVRTVKDDLARLRDEAARLDMAIDPLTNTVVPGPGFSGIPMELLLKQEQLQPQLDAIVAEANDVDAELAQAINMADGKTPIPAPPPGEAPIQQHSGGDYDAAESTGRSVLADVNRANDQAVIEAMRRVKAGQDALDKAAAEAYTHGPGSPEAQAALAQLPQLKKNLADALDQLGKIPDYSKIDPNSVSLSPDSNLPFPYTATGHAVQVTGTLKNGTGECSTRANWRTTRTN